MSKKEKSFNTLVLEKTIELLELTRLETAIFYRLLGFLLRDDKPFIYTAEKLAEKTLYKRASIFDGLKSLEEKKLITRTGFSYQRRFSKGSSLVEICTQVQKLDETELNTSPEPGLYRPKPGLYRPKSGYNKTNNNLSKHLGDVTKKLQNQTPKTQLKDISLCDEDKELLGDYKHGLKYPQLQLTGLKLQRAEIIYKRFN